MRREKTKHKGIYKMGEDYYITYYDGTTKISKKTGAPYLFLKTRKGLAHV